MRLALGVAYSGSGYHGWQSQKSANTIQDFLENALSRFAASPIRTICAGRTDAGVHALMQVVHFDTEILRTTTSWVRGTNSFLPANIAVQWVKTVPDNFHARGSTVSRKYCYVLLQSPIRPSVEVGRVGWIHQTLDLEAMQAATNYLIGEHDFSSFRASACQALSPIKSLKQITIKKTNSLRESDCCYWRFEFEGNAFLHHMIRNIMGCLIVIGKGEKPAIWMQEVLKAKSRKVAAPTFSPDGLYFLGPQYACHWGLPEKTVAYDWLP